MRADLLLLCGWGKRDGSATELDELGGATRQVDGSERSGRGGGKGQDADYGSLCMKKKFTRGLYP